MGCSSPSRVLEAAGRSTDHECAVVGYRHEWQVVGARDGIRSGLRARIEDEAEGDSPGFLGVAVAHSVRSGVACGRAWDRIVDAAEGCCSVAKGNPSVESKDNLARLLSTTDVDHCVAAKFPVPLDICVGLTHCRKGCRGPSAGGSEVVFAYAEGTPDSDFRAVVDCVAELATELVEIDTGGFLAPGIVVHVVPDETCADSVTATDIAALVESGCHEELPFPVLFRHVFASEEVVATERSTNLEPSGQAAKAETRIDSHTEAEVIVVVVVAFCFPCISGEEELRVGQESADQHAATRVAAAPVALAVHGCVAGLAVFYPYVFAIGSGVVCTGRFIVREVAHGTAELDVTLRLGNCQVHERAKRIEVGQFARLFELELDARDLLFFVGCQRHGEARQECSCHQKESVPRHLHFPPDCEDRA